jgi:DNA-binding transcriptional ArsR family regulator
MIKVFIKHPSYLWYKLVVDWITKEDMGHSPVIGAETHTGRKEGREGTDIKALLGTLEDPDSRAIMEATSTQALSAKEVAESCDLPLSTTYRKLDQLTEVGVLKKQVRLSQSEQYPSEYTLHINHIELHVDPDSGIQLSISREGAAQSEYSLVAEAD